MAFKEEILTGRAKRILASNDSGERKYYKISDWTHAIDVWFDTGKNLIQTLMGKADILTVSTTVFVTENGNDTTGDGTSNKPYRSIQKAIEQVPVINGNFEYTINIGAGTYNGFLAKNVSATLQLSGDITITGDGSENYLIENDSANIKITGNGHVINIIGEYDGSLVYIHNGGRINSYEATFKFYGKDKNGGTGIYIISDGGFSQSSANISFENLMSAIHVSTNSVFYADGIYGGNLTNGIICSNGGQVAYGTNTMTTTNENSTSNGGRILTGSQE